MTLARHRLIRAFDWPTLRAPGAACARRLSSSFKCLPFPKNVSRTKFEIKKGTGFKSFFDIHDKFVTDFPYCQVFDRQFFVLNVKQIRKSTISFGLLIQMEGKF